MTESKILPSRTPEVELALAVLDCVATGTAQMLFGTTAKALLAYISSLEARTAELEADNAQLREREVILDTKLAKIEASVSQPASGGEK